MMVAQRILSMQEKQAFKDNRYLILHIFNLGAKLRALLSYYGDCYNPETVSKGFKFHTRIPCLIIFNQGKYCRRGVVTSSMEMTLSFWVCFASLFAKISFI